MEAISIVSLPDAGSPPHRVSASDVTAELVEKDTRDVFQVTAVGDLRIHTLVALFFIQLRPHLTHRFHQDSRCRSPEHVHEHAVTQYGCRRETGHGVLPIAISRQSADELELGWAEGSLP